MRAACHLSRAFNHAKEQVEAEYPDCYNAAKIKFKCTLLHTNKNNQSHLKSFSDLNCLSVALNATGWMTPGNVLRVSQGRLRLISPGLSSHYLFPAEDSWNWRPGGPAHQLCRNRL